VATIVERQRVRYGLAKMHRHSKRGRGAPRRDHSRRRRSAEGRSEIAMHARDRGRGVPRNRSSHAVLAAAGGQTRAYSSHTGNARSAARTPAIRTPTRRRPATTPRLLESFSPRAGARYPSLAAKGRAFPSLLRRRVRCLGHGRPRRAQRLVPTLPLSWADAWQEDARWNGAKYTCG